MGSKAYAAAGVNLDAAALAKKRIAKVAKSTFVPGVIGGIGAFGGLFNGVFKGLKSPVLVSSTDSVGTKVKLATLMKKHDSVGRDIVNHCVNDILVQGARPLFFLDYIALDRMNPPRVAELMKGLTRACRENGCALIGGETAALPGVYAPDEYDLVGFIVGVVDRPKLLDGRRCRAGDVLIGIPSSGLHTNGYSLARKVLVGDGAKGRWRALRQAQGSGAKKLGEKLPDGRTLGQALLEPHRSYLGPVMAALKTGAVHGLAHITGGGYFKNLPRVVKPPLSSQIDVRAWEPPPLFRLIQERGRIPEFEMYNVFNMGMGMILSVEPRGAARVLDVLRRLGEGARVLGEVRPKGPPVVLEGLGS